MLSARCKYETPIIERSSDIKSDPMGEKRRNEKKSTCPKLTAFVCHAECMYTYVNPVPALDQQVWAGDTRTNRTKIWKEARLLFVKELSHLLALLVKNNFQGCNDIMCHTKHYSLSVNVTSSGETNNEGTPMSQQTIHTALESAVESIKQPCSDSNKTDNHDSVLQQNIVVWRRPKTVRSGTMSAVKYPSILICPYILRGCNNIAVLSQEFCH